MLKNLRTRLFFALVLLSGYMLQAQDKISFQQKVGLLKTTANENDQQLKDISFFANISGEEKLLYLNKEWQNGLILTKDGRQLFFTGRLELLNQIIEMSIDGKVWVLTMGFVDLIKIGESIFIPVNRNQIKGGYKNVCAELLYNGKTKLFAVYETEIKTVRQGISESSRSETRMIYKERFFVSNDLESFRPLPSKRKLLSELFQSQLDKVSKYMEENKLKRNRDDLIDLFRYYEEIGNEGG